MPRICVAIQAENNEQTIKSVLKADEADLIEIRLDYRKENLNLPAIRKSTDKLLIATNRRKDQGGNAVEPEQERLGLLMDAVDAGFDYVDIASTTESLAETVQVLKEKGAKVIVSYHDFEHPLNANQLEGKHSELAETGC
ncbi:type I 3-dehydroquinate dehydratase, partial [Candidatus Bathyarchaeota archaeon]|nr:type I 3-dehydroquinate dehydratase [Candidatus Bathyarchaeota archaeon]